MGQYVVYRDDGGRWIVSRSFGGPSIGDWVAPRSQEEAIDLLRRHLAAKGEVVNSIQQGGGIVNIVAGTAREPVPYDITLRLSAMPEVARLLEELSAKLRKSSAETIIQALVMLKIVVDAGDAGKRIAIIDDDLNVIQEILIPGRSHDHA
jgi:hypothetical protein